MNYIVLLYNSDNYKSTIQPQRSFHNPKNVIGYKGNKIKSDYMEGLLAAFETSFESPEFDQMGVSKKYFKGLTSKKKLMEEIRKNHAEDRLSEFSKERKNTLFTDFRNIDNFNRFLNERFDTTGNNSEPANVSNDSWEDLNIIIKTKKKFYRFSSSLSLLKQPFYNKTDVKDDIYPIHNLSINKYLLRILPYDFTGREKMDINALMNDYFDWYLKRNGLESNRVSLR